MAPSAITERQDAGAATLQAGVEHVVDALRASGVDHVFGLPGTTIMDLIDALGRRDGIRYLSTRHEQAAAHMADGFWRASGRVAVALASRGPGAANLLIGVHNAYAESVPLVAIVGQIPDAIAHRESFEEMDVVTTFAPSTKWAIEVHDAARLGELVARGVRTAVSGRPRPVLVSLPLDVQQRVVEGPPAPAPAPALHPAPDPAELDGVARMLVEARRPVVVVGGGLLRPAAHAEEAQRLAEALGAPMVTTWLRKGAVPNGHPAFAGSLGYGAHASADRAVAESDVLIALGCRFSEFSTKRYALIGDATRIIQVDIDPDEIGAVYGRAVGVVGDAAAVAGALTVAVERVRGGSAAPSDELLAYRDALHRDCLAETAVPADPADGAGGVPSTAVVRALAKIVRERDPLIVQDAHSLGPWIARHLAFDRPGRYFAAAGGSMGWGLPAALGVQAARPDARVLAVCGDGSFLMVAQEMETAVREGLPVVAVVTNNFSFGNTRDRQRHAHGGRYFGTLLGNPDFAEFARSLGGHGERVTDAGQVAPAIERALDAGCPAIVDVIQDNHEGLPGDLQPPAAR